MTKLFNCDCLEYMPEIADCSVDVILTDPPYLYLKNQKLDVPFDEQEFFHQCRRVLKDDGFIVLFGRGESFYRWNISLSELGFKFKEEIIWDKAQNSSPVSLVSRVHETVSIFTKKNGLVNKVRVPYIQMKQHNLDQIIADCKRIKSVLNNTKSLDDVISFLGTKKLTLNEHRRSKSTTVAQANLKSADRAAATFSMFSDGLRERSIIKVLREHYQSIHPTQKPVELLKRLLNLVSKPNCLVLDPFTGSGSTAIAAHELGMNFIGCEIDEEYCGLAQQRITAETDIQLGIRVL